MNILIGTIHLIVAGLTCLMLALVLLLLVDLISIIITQKRESKVYDKERRNGLYVFIKIVLILFLALVEFSVLILQLIEEYNYLSIINIALLIASIVIVAIYIILSLIIIIKKRKGTLKLERAIMAVAIIAIIILAVTRTNIKNIYTENQYRDYYEYQKGDYAYIEDMIEREVNA